MTTRQWVLPVAITVVAAGSGGSVAVLAGGAVEEPQPVVRAEALYAWGPSATCSRDSSSTGAVRPLRVATPAHAPAYDMVIEVSSTDWRARACSPSGHEVGRSPSELPPSTTHSWLADQLCGAPTGWSARRAEVGV